MSTISQSISALTGITSPARSQPQVAYTANMDAWLTAIGSYMTQIATYSSQVNTVATELNGQPYGYLALPVTTTGITLTNAQTNVEVLELTGTINATRAIALAANIGPVLVVRSNNGPTLFTLNLQAGNGSGNIEPLSNFGVTALVYANGNAITCLNRTVVLAHYNTTSSTAVTATPAKPTITIVSYVMDGGTLNTPTAGLTCLEPGLYLVTASAQFTNTGAAIQDVTLQIYKNGAAVATAVSSKKTQSTSATEKVFLSITSVIALASGDTLELYASASTGVTFAGAGSCGLNAVMV